MFSTWGNKDLVNAEVLNVIRARHKRPPSLLVISSDAAVLQAISGLSPAAAVAAEAEADDQTVAAVSSETTISGAPSAVALTILITGNLSLPGRPVAWRCGDRDRDDRS